MGSRLVAAEVLVLRQAEAKPDPAHRRCGDDDRRRSVDICNESVELCVEILAEPVPPTAADASVMS
jgi:hypothetical protein